MRAASRGFSGRCLASLSAGHSAGVDGFDDAVNTQGNAFAAEVEHDFADAAAAHLAGLLEHVGAFIDFDTFRNLTLSEWILKS